MQEHKPVILILGPTAAGKTAVAIELARRLRPGGGAEPSQTNAATIGGECVCADSMQIYRRMDIGTAKPSAADRAAVPHHLVDLADPSDDTFNVDGWLAQAVCAIVAIRARNRAPIVVGGTNLYVQSLLYGMADSPEPHPRLRDALSRLDDRELRQRLERADPAAAGRIHPNDRRRTIRALEVFEQSGQRLSDLQRHWPGAASASARRGSQLADVCIIGLDFSVEAINRRINARVRAMVEAGLVDEVRSLWQERALGRNAREALGYKQIIKHLEGECSLDEAIEQVKIRTRQYAKQQRSWLRRFRQIQPSLWIDATDQSAQYIANKAFTFISDRGIGDCVAPEAAPSANAIGVGTG